ncbi:MAG TPA: elongation factor G [Acidobacteriota bacterium]|nr:elongation factor G [Acidobacteriota bacterium]
MKNYESSAIRNVAVVGHGDCGKTSLVAAMLFNSDMINRLGKVDDGTAPTDFGNSEIERKISINNAFASCEHGGNKINLVDSPGYAAFIHEAKAALRVVDAALIGVCGVAGIEVGTERVFKFCQDFELSRAFFVNKLDRDNSSFERTLDALNDTFDRRAVAMQMPIGKEKDFKGVVDLVKMKAYIYKGDGTKEFSEEEIPAEFQGKAQEAHTALEEMVAENDEELMELYFEAGELTPEQLIKGMRTAVADRQIFPVFCCSATHNIGVTQMLDIAAEILPSPVEKNEVTGKDPKSGEEKVVKASPDAPFSAFVFKTVVDPFAGRVSIFRVYSGELKSDSTVYNPNRESSERIGHLLILQGKQHEQVEALTTGDIGAVAKLRETHTGDSLCAQSDQIQYEPVQFPEPVIAYALEPKSRGDEEKVSGALAKLVEEDVMLRSERGQQTNELLVRGTGQLHIEVVVDQLKDKYGCEVILHPPKVPYRETITVNADVRARHKKQSGGRGQFADCAIKMEPLPRGTGYEFQDKIFGGSIPHTYRPAVDKGIQEAAAKGVLAGFPVVDFRVILYDGKDHPVDSSEMAFKIAGSLAFKEAVIKAKPALLEPIMNVEITIPDENTGDIMGDLSSRRGRPLGMDPVGSSAIIKAQVPMAEMLSYSSDLTSMTGGRGSYTMEFRHYEIVPSHLAEKIIEQVKKEKEEEKK